MMKLLFKMLKDLLYEPYVWAIMMVILSMIIMELAYG